MASGPTDRNLTQRMVDFRAIRMTFARRRGGAAADEFCVAGARVLQLHKPVRRR